MNRNVQLTFTSLTSTLRWSCWAWQGITNPVCVKGRGVIIHVATKYTVGWSRDGPPPWTVLIFRLFSVFWNGFENRICVPSVWKRQHGYVNKLYTLPHFSYWFPCYKVVPIKLNPKDWFKRENFDSQHRCITILIKR